MNLRYKVVFSLQLLHDYYREKACNDFSILPSAQTASVMKGHGLLFKAIGNKLIVMGRVDEDDRLISKMAASLKLSFYLELNNQRFFNFTNLQLPTGGKKYYFSNAGQTKVGTTLYLSSKIGVYDASGTYMAGALAANGSDTVFEAIRPSNGASARPLSDKEFWLSRGKVQYARAEDQIQVSSHLSLIQVVSSASFEVKVFGLNTGTGNYDFQVLDTINLSFAVPQTQLALRLENLSRGKYKIEVNGEASYIYIDDDALYRSVLGIIEIVNYLPASNSFALVGADGKPKAAVFTLNFANRSLFWKYIARTNDITSVNDSRPLPDKLTFTSLPDNQFVSARPVPVTENPLLSLSAESTALGHISPIANPGTDRLSTINMDGNMYDSAETHLNY